MRKVMIACGIVLGIAVMAELKANNPVNLVSEGGFTVAESVEALTTRIANDLQIQENEVVVNEVIFYENSENSAAMIKCTISGDDKLLAIIKDATNTSISVTCPEDTGCNLESFEDETSGTLIFCGTDCNGLNIQQN